MPMFTSQPTADMSWEVSEDRKHHIAGVDLQTYAKSLLPGIAASNGVDASSWSQAHDGWNARIKSDPGVASAVIELDLLVMMPSGIPMPVTRQETVAQLHLPRCQVGSTLKVKVEPNNPNSLWIDWNTLA